MAQKTIETCLIEDPALFLGHIFEKLSDKDRSQRKMANLLQKLPLILGRLAPHVAYTIFVNVVIFYLLNYSTWILVFEGYIHSHYVFYTSAGDYLERCALANTSLWWEYDFLSWSFGKHFPLCWRTGSEVSQNGIS